MSEAKHTEGCWVVKPWQTGISWHVGPEIIEKGIAPGGGDLPGQYIVAIVKDREEWAHLIAAAPDMKDGCNALIGLIQLVCARDDMPPHIKEALEKSHRLAEAKAALSKAEGRPE